MKQNQKTALLKKASELREAQGAAEKLPEFKTLAEKSAAFKSYVDSLLQTGEKAKAIFDLVEADGGCPVTHQTIKNWSSIINKANGGGGGGGGGGQSSALKGAGKSGSESGAEYCKAKSDAGTPLTRSEAMRIHVAHTFAAGFMAKAKADKVNLDTAGVDDINKVAKATALGFSRGDEMAHAIQSASVIAGPRATEADDAETADKAAIDAEAADKAKADAKAKTSGKRNGKAKRSDKPKAEKADK